MLLRRAVGASASTPSVGSQTAWRERSCTAPSRCWPVSGATSNPPDAFSALEAGEIDDSANVAPFAQVGERLVDLIELVVPGDQLV
jgi:hypothetical protein